MANKKISELTSGSTLGDTDLVPIVQGGLNKKITGLMVKTYAQNGVVTSIATTGLISGGTITSSGTISTNMASNRLVGRATAGAGIMEEITLGTGLSFSGTTLNATAGTVTSIATAGLISGGTITGSGTITTSMATNKLVGRGSAGTGIMEQITLGTGLSLSGTTLNGTGGTVTSIATDGLISGGTITGSGTIGTTMASGKLVGRYDTGSGKMQEITVGDGLTLTAGGQLNNTASPTPTGYYGAFSDFTTQTAAAANTGYVITLNSTDLSNGVSVTSGSRILFDNTGIYNLQFSVQLENSDTQEHDARIWLRKNGADIAGSTGYVAVVARHGGINGHVIPSWNFVLDVVAGDYFEYYWAVTGTQVTIATYSPSGPSPGTASVVVTATQQSGIMAGTGVTAINSLTGSAQTLATGTSGTDFAISSSGSTHTFNLPTASASARGLLSSANWTTFNSKQNALTLTTTGSGASTLVGSTLNIPIASGQTTAVDMQTAFNLLGSSLKGYNLNNPNFNLNTVSGLSLVSQRMYVYACYLPTAQTITGAKWWAVNTGNYTASNYNGIGLYSYSGGTLTLVASSTNDGNIWKTAGAPAFASKAFSSTYSASAGVYFVGLIYSSSAVVTNPTLPLFTNVDFMSSNYDFTNSAKLSVTLNSQTSIPSSISLASFNGTTQIMPIFLY